MCVGSTSAVLNLTLQFSVSLPVMVLVVVCIHATIIISSSLRCTPRAQLVLTRSFSSQYFFFSGLHHVLYLA